MVTTDLVVWNRSSYQLLDLRLHDGPSYNGAANLLTTPLVCEQQVTVTATTGQYVTVIRRKNLGENIALTTAEGLPIYGAGYVLIVFDESFRLVDPPSPMDDGPPGGDPGPLPGDPTCF